MNYTGIKIRAVSTIDRATNTADMWAGTAHDPIIMAMAGVVQDMIRAGVAADQISKQLDALDSLLDMSEDLYGE